MNIVIYVKLKLCHLSVDISSGGYPTKKNHVKPICTLTNYGKTKYELENEIRDDATQVLFEPSQ